MSSMSDFFINSKPPVRASKPRNIKSSNVRLILSLMDFENAVSAGEISHGTNLSKTTVSKVFTELQAKKIILSVGKGPSTDEGGKKPELSIINANYRHVIVILLSEILTIECSVLNLACQIKGSIKIDTEPSISYNDAIAKAANLACQLKEELGLTVDDICGVVVSCEGVVDTRNGIIRKPAHHQWQANLPVARDIEQALGFPAKVFIDNVCRYGGYAELILPENRQYSNLIVIWNDELVGGSVLIDRRMAQGRNGLIGEVGHMIIDPNSNVRCSCGAFGCFEALVSCERLLRTAMNTYRDYPNSSFVHKAQNGSLALSDIFNASNAGDQFAMHLIDHVVGHYATLIRNITALHDPEKVIIQGVYASAGKYFYQSLREKVAQNAIRGISDEIIITPSSFSDRMPRTTGAAFYGITQFFNSDVLGDS